MENTSVFIMGEVDTLAWAPEKQQKVCFYDDIFSVDTL